ncbi:hypothetical protein MLGJGCBP_07722 [Rhodococcus sp. T7]|nr:hypothetical protein MLGJGCBP_09128 [Rhodococcus sp. T7]KAF0959209.1 hypothetical protein MLGJGCBP_07722 [Rhodococcus sp. T7]
MIMVANTAALWIYAASVVHRYAPYGHHESTATSNTPPNRSVDLIVATAVDDVISALTAGRASDSEQVAAAEARRALGDIYSRDVPHNKT